MNQHKSNKIKEKSNTVRHLIMGQITTTQNLVAIKEARHAGQSLRCSRSIACRRCSNYIFILDLTPGFIGLGKDNCKTRRATFKFWDLVRFILKIYGTLFLLCWARGYKVKSMLNSMLINKNFLTWLLIGWCLCCQPIRCQDWKYLLTNMDLKMEIS